MINGKKTACVVLNYNDWKETSKYVNEITRLIIYDEIIIVDNASPDGSFTKLKELESSNIHVLSTDHNGGYGYGNNYGVRFAYHDLGCTIVAISNPDVSYNRESVLSMIDYLLKNERCILISGVQIDGYTNKPIPNSAWRLPTYSSYVLGSLFLLRNLLPCQFYSLNKPIEIVDCVAGAFLLVKAKEFLDCGGYDERVFLYCEESILAYRIKHNDYYSCIAKNETYTHYASNTIRKSIPSIVKRHKMILKSRLFYLENYLNISKLQSECAKLVFCVSTIEERIKQFIRSIL